MPCNHNLEEDNLTWPDFNHGSIEEMAFLIANKKNESFELAIKSIKIQ